MSAQPVAFDATDLLTSEYETFARLPEWVLDADISPRAVVLFAMLLRYADKGGKAWPSRDTLAKRMRVASVDTVDRALRELVTIGAISVEKQRRGAGWEHNVYMLMRRPVGSVSAAHDGLIDRKDAPCTGRTDRVQRAAQNVHEPEPPNESQSERESSSSSLRSSKPAQPQRQDVEQVCQRLAERMIENACKPPTVDKRWRDAARLMLDKDGRPLEQVLALIDWCQSDEFWRGNIMSVPKLREKYDMLRLRMQAEQRGNVHRGPWQGGKLTQATTDACRAGRMRVNL